MLDNGLIVGSTSSDLAPFLEAIALGCGHSLDLTAAARESRVHSVEALWCVVTLLALADNGVRVPTSRDGLGCGQWGYGRTMGDEELGRLREHQAESYRRLRIALARTARQLARVEQDAAQVLDDAAEDTRDPATARRRSQTAEMARRAAMHQEHLANRWEGKPSMRP